MPPKPQAKPGDKKGAGAQQLIDDDYSDLAALPPLNSLVVATLPAFKHRSTLNQLHAQMLKLYNFPPEDPLSSKFKTIQREDLINYAKLKQYLTEEESLDLAGKVTQERMTEILAKTTYDMLMSYEAQARRAKKDQPPQLDNMEVELTVWLKDFPQTANEFRAFYQYQQTQTLKQGVHSVVIIEEQFLLENEDEEILKFTSSDPTMERYYQEQERKRIEEKRKVEFLSEERVQVFFNALEISKMWSTSPDQDMKLGVVSKLKFQGPNTALYQEEPIEGSAPDAIDPCFSEFAQYFKAQVEQIGKDLYEYKKLKREFDLASQSMDSGPKPLMPFPEEVLQKIRAEEERIREQKRKQEEEKKAQEALLLQQQQAAQKKGGAAAKQQPAAQAKSRENLQSQLAQQRADSQLGTQQTEEQAQIKKPMVKSRDDEEKEWNFTHLEKIMSELSSENGTVGNILAAMIYQISNQRSLKPQTDPAAQKISDSDKQFILKSEEQETELNDYFDDIFNKLTIEHNIEETTFKHQFSQNLIVKRGDQAGSSYQNLFNENDRVSMIAQSYKFLSGEPISLCENSTLQNSKMPGINQRLGMPQTPSVPQPQRESDIAAIISFSAMPQSQARRALLLHQCEQMFKRKDVHPERDFFFLDRNYVERFDSTTLRQVLAKALRFNPDLVYHYDKNEDALLLGVYFKNPPGRLLRRQTTYPVKVFPDFHVWRKFIKQEQAAQLDFNLMYDIDSSKAGLMRTNSKYCFPSDNSIIRIDKHVIGNRRFGTSIVIKDNLAFGIKEAQDKFKTKSSLEEEEILSREAWALTDRKCLFWLEFENGVKLLVEMQEPQKPHLEEMPLQEPLPPEIQEEAKRRLEEEIKQQHGGDVEDKSPQVQVESVPVGQAKTLNKNESQKSVKAGGRDSQMKGGAKPPAQQQQQQQQMQKSDSAKSLESNQSQPRGPSPQELALMQKKRDEEQRLMSAASKQQFSQDRHDPTAGSKLTFTFQEGLIVQILPNGDVSQQLIENPQAKKKYGGTLHQDSLPALHEKSRLITRNCQVIRYFLDGNMQIFYPDGTVTTTDKRKGVWFTVNAKGVKRVRKLQDNLVYDEPKRMKITEKVDPETSATVLVREDGVLTIKYIDESKLVMMPDGTQILTKKNVESGSGTITLITKEGFAPVRIIFDPVKARAKTIIGLGGTDSMMGKDNIMERTNTGKVSEVLLPDKSIVQTYQERQELEGYNNFMTNMVHLIKREDFSIIKVRQDGEMVIISANQRAFLNQIGKQMTFGLNDYDHFFELFGVPAERRSGVFTINLDQGRLLTQDEEGNVFIVYANGDSVEKLSVSFNLDQMVEGIERKDPESPRINDGEYIEEECKFLPPPKTIAHPRLFMIKNDVGYEFFNKEQLEYQFRCADKDKDLLITAKQVKIDNEDAVSHLFMRKVKPFDPLTTFPDVTQSPKIPQSVELVNQTVSIPVDPVREQYVWKNILEYQKMDSPQQVSQFKEMLKRYQSMRTKQVNEKQRLKVTEVKSEEHREHECKIWLRIAKERGIDVPSLVGEEYKPLKEIVNEEIKQKFLDTLDKFDSDEEGLVN